MNRMRTPLLVQLVAPAGQDRLVEAHEVADLVDRAAPVLGGEGVDGQPPDAELEGSLDGVEQRLLAGGVALGALQAPLLGPAAVAVHHQPTWTGMRSRSNPSVVLTSAKLLPETVDRPGSARPAQPTGTVAAVGAGGEQEPGVDASLERRRGRAPRRRRVPARSDHDGGGRRRGHRARPAPRGAGRDRHGQEPRLPRARAAVRAPGGRGHRDQGTAGPAGRQGPPLRHRAPRPRRRRGRAEGPLELRLPAAPAGGRGRRRPGRLELDDDSPTWARSCEVSSPARHLGRDVAHRRPGRADVGRRTRGRGRR